MAEQKTIGQINYEGFNRFKGNAIDWPLGKGAAVEEMQAWEAAASAVWDQAVEACIKAQKAAIDEAVSEMNELAMLGAKPLWNSLISRFDDLPEALAALKRSDKPENANV